MKSLKILLIVFCLTSFFSCATFKENKTSEHLTELTENNIELINGTYKHNDENRPLPMDYFWGSYYKMKEYDSVYKLVYEQKLPYYVNLNAINKKKIGVEIYVDGKILKSYVIKGKIKNGYFEQNRKIYAIPMIIFNMYHNSKFRIGRLDNGNIITDYNKKSYAHYVLGFKNNSENLVNIEHVKVNKDTIK